MKIVVVGGTGLVGGHVVEALDSEHEIIKVGYDDGDFNVDISDLESIKKLFKEIGSFDALVSATGLVEFGPLSELTQEQWRVGFDNKLMGQVSTNGTCVCLHGNGPKPHACKCSQVCCKHPVVRLLGTGFIKIERIAIFHVELATSHHPKTRTNFITELQLDLKHHLR